MPEMTFGAHANIVLEVGQVLHVTSIGQTTVQSKFGAPAGTTTLNSQTQNFGPYFVQAKLRVVVVTGQVTYTVDAKPVAPVSIGGFIGLGQVASAILAPGWTVTGWQWHRVVAGVDTPISGAVASLYTQQSADVAAGAVIYPEPIGLKNILPSQGAGDAPSNPGDTTAPTLSSVIVANATPSTIALTFSESMDTTLVPAAGIFTVSAGHPITAAAWGSSTVLNLTTSSAFVNGEAARTLSITTSANLVDAAGNPLAAVTARAITNNVAATDTTPPTVTAMAIADASPAVINITLSEAMAATLPTTGAFAVLVNGTARSVTARAYGTTTRLDLTLASAAAYGDTVTLAYTSAGAMTDVAGNPLASFAAAAVTNNIAAPAADTRPRFGYGIANDTGDSGAAGTVFASMTALTGSANGGRAGTFATVSSTTNFTWLAVLHSVVGAGLHVNDGVGPGGWNGAQSTGLYTGADADPSVIHITYTDGSSNVWDLFRSDGKAIDHPTFTLS